MTEKLTATFLMDSPLEWKEIGKFNNGEWQRAPESVYQALGIPYPKPVELTGEWEVTVSVSAGESHG